MAQKCFALLLLVVCGVLGYVALDYQAAFSYEPVGPRAWPLILLALLALGAFSLLFAKNSGQGAEDAEKTAHDAHLTAKVAGCVLLLLGYSALFEALGFIPAAMLLGLGLAWLYGGTLRLSAVSGLVLGIGLYFLFDRALDVPLPLGILSDWEI